MFFQNFTDQGGQSQRVRRFDLYGGRDTVVVDERQQLRGRKGQLF
jgi:hypothetical protein